MPRASSSYAIELTKIIVVHIEADSEAEAVERVANDDDGFDGAWERAEPTIKVINEEN